ncbi:MAG: sulfotransferase [Alphaproteobacteria bacterium]
MQQGRPRQKSMNPEQAMALATQLIEANRLPEAENLCRRVIQAQPGSHAAWFSLGLIAVKSGKLPVAADMMKNAAKLAPTHAAYHRSLGEVHRRLGGFAQAIEHGTNAVRLAPADPEAHYNLALALSDSGANDNAVAQYKKVLALNPSHNLAANNLGAVLERMGNEEDAEEAYARAIAINPRHAEAQNNLGAILSARGDLDKARECFSAAIEADPAFVHAHYNLSTLKKYTADDPHLKALEAIARRGGNMPSETRLRFCFAVGKAFEDVGRYDEAFAAYAEGNRLKRATFNYDEKQTTDSINAIIQAYDKKFAAKKVKGCADETPVFILGMPRSGTTLIEQIISSHSAVHGAGELHDLGQAINDVTGAPAVGNYMQWVKDADAKTLSRIGETYVTKLRARDPKALRITDKMPGNFFYVGLIHKILPKAKIIHSMRNPMDTCFSNYSRLFNETMVFAYDLQELGRYYNNYKRMMDHWHAVLPKGTILDVSYEELVEDQEAQSRKLLEFCGLDWQDACLEFHKNDRPVKTASIAQVRKPMYKNSIARWERFGKHLAPLRAAIDEGEKK